MNVPPKVEFSDLSFTNARADPSTSV